MHDKDAQGNEFFKCDFCGKPWAEDRPMVEGHQGSLICGKCLTAAFTEVVHMGGGGEHAGSACALCLEVRKDPQWASPLRENARACRRCIKQSAAVLANDEDSAWKRPEAPGGAAQAADAANTHDDEE
jgi:hypothetical protein